MQHQAAPSSTCILAFGEQRKAVMAGAETVILGHEGKLRDEEIRASGRRTRGLDVLEMLCQLWHLLRCSSRTSQLLRFVGAVGNVYFSRSPFESANVSRSWAEGFQRHFLRELSQQC